MLYHSKTLHDGAEQRYTKRLERVTDNLSNSLETFVKEWQVYFSQLIGVSRRIHSAHLCTVSNPTIEMVANIICDPIYKNPT